MSKVSLKKADIEPKLTATSSGTLPQSAKPDFSNGDLGQLQEILFGQQQRNTHEQIDALQNQFTEQLNTLSNVLHSRLTQLTDTIDQTNKRFEQNIIDLKNTNQSGLEKINQTLNTTKAELQTNISALSESTDQDTERLGVELADNDIKLRSELNEIKQSLRAEISQSINDLNAKKLDTQDLARMFSDVSGKLTEPSA